MATSDAPLSVPNVTLAVARGATIPVSNADFSYFENFEGLNKGETFGEVYNDSITQANPVTFPAAMQIVSVNDPIAALPETVPNVPINPKVVNASPEAGRTGDSSNAALRFAYSGSADLQADAWQEQRFNLNSDFLPAGVKGLKEVWMQYDQYIPANYTQRDTDPTAQNYGSGPRKVLALFGDGYSDPYPTYVLEAWTDEYRDPYVPDGSYARSYFIYTSADGTRNFGGGGVGFDPAPFIVDPRIEKGHWARRTLHIKLPTSATSNDGVIEFWVQRLVDTANPVVEKVVSVSGLSFYDPVRPYLNGGYLMGYTNQGFDEDTTFLISNFILSSSSGDVDLTATDLGV